MAVPDNLYNTEKKEIVARFLFGLSDTKKICREMREYMRDELSQDCDFFPKTFLCSTSAFLPPFSSAIQMEAFKRGIRQTENEKKGSFYLVSPSFSGNDFLSRRISRRLNYQSNDFIARPTVKVNPSLFSVDIQGLARNLDQPETKEWLATTKETLMGDRSSLEQVRNGKINNKCIYF